MAVALQKLAEEDPTFRVSTNHETGQTIIAGMGELHLEIIIDRLLREFKVEANVGKPQVAYRERPGHEVDERRGQVRPPVRRSRPVRPRGHQHVPAGTGRGLPVREQDRRRRGSQGIHPVHRQGHPGGAELRRSGRLSRSRTLRVELIDGSYHDVDSSEAAFKVAGSMAIKDALKKSNPGHPRAGHGRGDRDAGRVHRLRHGRHPQPPRHDPGPGAARQRRGHSVPRCRWARCSATPPTCAPARRAVLSYTMQFDSYEPVPKNVADEIISKAGGNA